MRKEQRMKWPCTTCDSKGILWMCGKEYIVCPICEGRRFIEVVEARIEPPKIYPVRRVA